MSFLQPWLLLGLPLLLLPIIIHLINQWRYQTKQWGAMMFLLAANRMARGYAKLRQFLILAMRALAILGLILAASRPLASGLLGLGGAKSDTVLVLLDRSPSMQQKGPNGAESKLETACRQLRESLRKVGANHWLLIDGGSEKPQEFADVDAMFDAPQTLAASATSDLPSLLQAAIDYLQNNQPGPTEIWIGSDLRQSDWQPTNSQWNALQDAIKKFPQTVRIQLLAFPEDVGSNLAIRVSDVRQETTEANGNELVLSLNVTRTDPTPAAVAVPIQVEVNGARSELSAELTGSGLEIKNHRIPLDPKQSRGWGRVSIPADANSGDNEYYFVFDQPPPKRTLVVAEDPDIVRPLELSASISSDTRSKAMAEVVTPEQASQVDWDDVGLLLWQGRLPEASLADDINRFVERGGRAIFFPPSPRGDGKGDEALATGSSYFGMEWQGWKAGNQFMVENWRSDQDLLAATRSGAALPVGQIELSGYATLTGEASTLASIMGGDPLLVRVPTDHGGVYFCTASPHTKYSNLARGGIVLYVIVQRALELGAQSLTNTSERTAGKDALLQEETDWRLVAGDSQALSTEYALRSGVYEKDEKLTAINRSIAEDQTLLVPDTQLDELFRGLEFRRISSQAGSLAAIIREIWRLFLIAMIVAMLLEAFLCIPRPLRSVQTGSLRAGKATGISS